MGWLIQEFAGDGKASACHADARRIDPHIRLGYTFDMTQSSVFKSNKSQAIRLPKPVALPEHVKRVEVIPQGAGRLIVPAGGSWEAFFAGPRIDEDFLSERRQPHPQVRKAD